MAFEANELALAYELRQEGCSWKRIAQGLGCDWTAIKGAVENAVARGLRAPGIRQDAKGGRRATYTLQMLRAAGIQRANGLSWSAVARHLGADPERLRKAHRYAVQTAQLG